jgi:hypothetical protein
MPVKKIKNNQIPLRIPLEDRVAAQRVANLNGLSLADILRMAIKQGTPRVARLLEQMLEEAKKAGA